MKNYNDTIISLTSYGQRLKYVSKTIFSIIKYSNIKIILTIQEDDIKNLTEDIKLLRDTGKIEIITCKENLGPHTKYYYAMKKYKDKNIITIDDDAIYSSDLVESLYNLHLKYNNSIICRRAHLITFNNGNIKPYKQWSWETNSTDTRHVMATGVGGILYPANILDIDNLNLDEIKKCFYADDIYLKVIENRKNIDIKIVDTKQRHPKLIAETQLSGLRNINVSKNRNDEYIKIFELDLK